MAVIIITPSDLEPFATIDAVKAAAMIEDATAMAVRVAPCIASIDFTDGPAVKAILRGALLRWNDAGSGAIQAQTATPKSECHVWLINQACQVKGQKSKPKTFQTNFFIRR